MIYEVRIGMRGRDTGFAMFCFQIQSTSLYCTVQPAPSIKLKNPVRLCESSKLADSALWLPSVTAAGRWTRPNSSYSEVAYNFRLFMACLSFHWPVIYEINNKVFLNQSKEKNTYICSFLSKEASLYEHLHCPLRVTLSPHPDPLVPHPAGTTACNLYGSGT